MNKSEIQARIEETEMRIKKLHEYLSELDNALSSLKANLEKRDCTDGMEQEKCWHGVSDSSGVHTVYAMTKQEAANYSTCCRPAYMPECRQVTADDVRAVFQIEDGTISHDEFAKRAHKLGFRMKVTK